MIHFFQFTMLLVIFVIVLNATLKIFDISFSKPRPRNSMFIHPVYKEDKIISLHIYIYNFNLHGMVYDIYMIYLIKGKH